MNKFLVLATLLVISLAGAAFFVDYRVKAYFADGTVGIDGETVQLKTGKATVDFLSRGVLIPGITITDGEWKIRMMMRLYPEPRTWARLAGLGGEAFDFRRVECENVILAPVKDESVKISIGSAVAEDVSLPMENGHPALRFEDFPFSSLDMSNFKMTAYGLFSGKNRKPAVLSARSAGVKADGDVRFSVEGLSFDSELFSISIARSESETTAKSWKAVMALADDFLNDRQDFEKLRNISYSANASGISVSSQGVTVSMKGVSTSVGLRKNGVLRSRNKVEDVSVENLQALQKLGIIAPAKLSFTYEDTTDIRDYRKGSGSYAMRLREPSLGDLKFGLYFEGTDPEKMKIGGIGLEYRDKGAVAYAVANLGSIPKVPVFIPEYKKIESFLQKPGKISIYLETDKDISVGQALNVPWIVRVEPGKVPVEEQARKLKK